MGDSEPCKREEKGFIVKGNGGHVNVLGSESGFVIFIQHSTPLLSEHAALRRTIVC